MGDLYQLIHSHKQITITTYYTSGIWWWDDDVTARCWGGKNNVGRGEMLNDILVARIFRVKN